MTDKPHDIANARLPRASYAQNFADLHAPFNAHEASVEADRCYFCHDAPCMTACPTSINIPLFIRQIQTGMPENAAKTIFDQNILGGMCARVCPTETLCEQVCVREVAEGKPVKIGQLQRYATDAVILAGKQPYERASPTGKKIAVVGAGPAGLACAHRLSLLGHAVTIFEARNKAGGLNEYGIAAYKATNDFAQKEVDFILSLGGITLELGKVLGQNLGLKHLQSTYDAVFLGLGLPAVNALGLEDEEATGLDDAVRYIADLRQAHDLSSLPVGRRVVVIGGGMTAIDIAIQSKLLGAEEVTILYRRGPEQMKASRYEQELAKARGVVIRHWLAPHALHRADGKLSGITARSMALRGDGLQASVEETHFPADMLFKAIGQKAVDVTGGLLQLREGRIAVDEERRTSVAGLWAGGDCVAGGEDLTVAAVDDGRRAAQSIHQFLSR